MDMDFKPLKILVLFFALSLPMGTMAQQVKGGAQSYLASDQVGLLSGKVNLEVARLQQRQEVKTVHVFKMARPLADSNLFNFELPSGEKLAFLRYALEQHPGNVIVWKGRTEGGDGRAMLGFNGDRFSGNLEWRGRIFDIRQQEGGIYLLVEGDLTREPPTHAPRKPVSESSIDAVTAVSFAHNQAGLEAIRATPMGVAQLTNNAVINIYFAFTPQASVNFSGNLSLAASFTVSAINEIMLNSGNAVRVQSVGLGNFDTEYSSVLIALTRIKVPSLKQARDFSNADVVMVFGNYIDACGAAPVFPEPLEAYAAVASNCLNKYSNAAHEIGHILGGRHDIADDSTNSPFADGHGYKFRVAVPNQTVFECFKTMMADSKDSEFKPADKCINNTQGTFYNRWSAPTQARPTGPELLGNTTTANMTRVVSVTGPIVARYREKKAMAGILASIQAYIFDLLSD